MTESLLESPWHFQLFSLNLTVMQSGWSLFFYYWWPLIEICVTASILNSSLYSGSSYHYCSLDCLDSSCDFQLFQLPYQTFGDRWKCNNYSWYYRSLHVPWIIHVRCWHSTRTPSIYIYICMCMYTYICACVSLHTSSFFSTDTYCNSESFISVFGAISMPCYERNQS